MEHCYTRRYIEHLITLEESFDSGAVDEMIHCLARARTTGSRVFVFGNGGSAAHANHFAGDLGKNVTREETGRFLVLSLCENMTAITAYANDMGYENVFIEQLKNQCLTKEDVVLAISSSGNSPNVVLACEYARGKGTKVLSLTGFSGGRLKEISDVCLHVPCEEYEKVEDLHMAALHCVVSYFRRGGR